MQRILIVLPFVCTLAACAPAAPANSPSALYVFRLNPPALIELNSSLQPAREVTVSIPEGCAVEEVHAAPHGPRLALELSCPFGQAVLTVDALSGAVKQPVTDSDSHFLAWSADGEGLYLKVNSINQPKIIRIDGGGVRHDIPISELTYDLAPRPHASGTFTFALSDGMGQGSELWLAEGDGSSRQQIGADPVSYLSLARWSPDGKMIAFIQIPDSPTPYTVGRLWIMHADGSSPRMLADVDAGHGFAVSWSPDGQQIAFVHRENPDDAQADDSANALVSNIHVVNLEDGREKTVTEFSGARVEAPTWQPDGDKIAFSVGLDDKMTAYVLEVSTGALQSLAVEAACCSMWVQR